MSSNVSTPPAEPSQNGASEADENTASEADDTSRLAAFGQRLSDDGELTKTVVFAGVGLASLLLALIVGWAVQPEDPAVYSDVGEAFYPDFDDASKAAGITVAAWDDGASRVQTFEVKREDGGWVIPTHSGYPADGQTQLVRAATSVIGIGRDALVDVGPDDFARLNLIDPLDTGYTGVEGRGKRVQLVDRGGQTLADYIVGNEAETDGRYYVRRPDEDRVYVAAIDLDVSTRFEDWIKPDLLDIDPAEVVDLTINREQLDERAGTIKQVDLIELDRGSTDGDWAFAATDPGVEAKVDEGRVDEILTALDDLELIGVRRKPQALANLLAGRGGSIGLSTEISLRDKGFFLTQAGELVSLEGTFSTGLANGVRYQILFGREFSGTAVDIEVGGADGANEKTEDDAATEAEMATAINGRYLFIQAQFDKSLLPELPSEPAAPSDEADDAAKAAYETELAAYEQAVADRERAIEDGEEKVKELTERFADWYYVVPSATFDTLAVGRDQLTDTPETDEPDGAGTATDAAADAPAPPSEDGPAEPAMPSRQPVLPSIEPASDATEPGLSEVEAKHLQDFVQEQQTGPSQDE